MDLEKRILKATKYKRTVGELRFTASMFSNTDLQNYLTIIHGPQAETEIGQNTIGSIAHAGMEKLLPSDRAESNERKFEIIDFNKTGWTISGTADKVLFNDNEKIDIRDYKFTKKYTGKKVKEEPNHAYNLQLNFLKMLMDSPGQFPGRHFTMTIDMFYKDADLLYREKSYEAIPVNIITDIEARSMEKILALDAIIKSGEIPSECGTKDLWIRKLKNGTTIRSRCLLYCSVNHVCPYYKPERPQDAVSRW